nr:hypothetical protein [Fischerella sp. FACHB-380]
MWGANFKQVKFSDI